MASLKPLLFGSFGDNAFKNNTSRTAVWGFPGGAVVKNPPVNAGNKGSSPGQGRSHMPWSN